jgi:DNA repair exonuclease SbcCD ATPase subunit
MPSKHLLDQIKEYDEYRARERDEARRLATQLRDLERQQKTVYDQLATDNANNDTRRQADRVDGEIAELKKRIAENQQVVQTQQHAWKTRILRLQKETLDEMGQELERKQGELAKLRTDEIPTVETLLARLRERASDLETETRGLQKDIRKTTQLNPEGPGAG